MVKEIWETRDEEGNIVLGWFPAAKGGALIWYLEPTEEKMGRLLHGELVKWVEEKLRLQKLVEEEVAEDLMFLNDLMVSVDNMDEEDQVEVFSEKEEEDPQPQKKKN